ncbi:PKD domain-containing protein [Streptomyces sp. NPDC090022]|uniref:PKD domain-containing protein n=1 Tax=Streptomyces sp. NPDC090022 TaxID=3365920 RepID=UPI00380D8B83
MRPTRTTILLTTGLVTLLGMPAAAAAGTPDTLHVNNRPESGCSDSGTGSQAVPYCTISAAAKVAQPGQTVRIQGGTYPESLTLDRSGEPGKPIVFEASATLAGSLTVNGASHVAVRGLKVDKGLQVTRSTGIELDRLQVNPAEPTDFERPAVVIGEASADVRLTRGKLFGVRVEGGAQRTVLGRSEIYGVLHAPVDAQDAPGTAVTNNTLHLDCGAAVSLTGTSTGSAVFNNLVRPMFGGTCPAPERVGISVAPSATSGTRADYNLLIEGAKSQLTAYRWGGTAYETAAEFAAATGQGAHDILVPSAMGVVDGVDGSPAIDSGDPTAPGVLPSDERGFPTADDPRVPNTGKDGGFIDRGHRETQDYLTKVSMTLDQPWAPAGTPVTATATTDSRWPAGLTYRFDFGDGTAPVVTKERSATHVYASPCACTVKATAVTGVGVEVSGEQAAKVTAPDVPLTAGLSGREVLPAAGDLRSYVAPLSVDFEPTAPTAPWPVQRWEADFGDGTQGSGSSLERFRHVYAQPGEYKVTVTLHDAKGAKATATTSVRTGYAASGYVPVTPRRVLDTRATNTPLQGGTPAKLALPAYYEGSGGIQPGGMAAAVLNVTVTDASNDTHLNVWPAGQPRPATSNVNVLKGGTASNTVTVPVGAYGQVMAQLNAGTAGLVVDFVGYYQPNSGERFSPVAPARVADTRTAGGPLGGGQTRTVKVAGVGGIPADAAAVALNLTSTGSSANSHVIAYPDPAQRTATSNLNPEPGRDKSNQAIVPVGPNGTITLYNHTGSTDLVVDAVGFYGKGGTSLFQPAVPKRLADTRETGKLAPGATTVVAGIPSNATGAVVNVTATDTSAPGFLTVYAYGGIRPEASSLNTRPGATVPNHVTTPVSGGRINVSNSWGGSNHVITDLLGWFTQS